MEWSPGNSMRKLEEESNRKWLMEKEQRRLKMMDDKSSEKMHGLWFGSVDTFNYGVTFLKCLQRPTQMVRGDRYLVSDTPLLDGHEVVLQVHTTLASIPSVVQNIWNEGGLLAFFRGTSMILENQGSGSDFWLSRPRPNQSLTAVTHSAIVDCTCPVFTAAAPDLCAKQQKV